MKNPSSFADFEAEARAAGFDEVLERRWDAHAVVPEHSHPFSVRAVVASGEMWLTSAGETRHLRAGDRFELGHAEPHAERYGSEGAVYWVARRHA